MPPQLYTTPHTNVTTQLQKFIYLVLIKITNFEENAISILIWILLYENQFVLSMKELTLGLLNAIFLDFLH